MKVIFSSQFRDSSGYASAARSYLKALDSVSHDLDLSVLSISVEKNSHISEEEENLIKKYEIDLTKINNLLQEDCLLIWHQPAGMVMFGDNHLRNDSKWIASSTSTVLSPSMEKTFFWVKSTTSLIELVIADFHFLG